LITYYLLLQRIHYYMVDFIFMAIDDSRASLNFWLSHLPEGEAT
jgi:hypothetical protein